MFGKILEVSSTLHTKLYVAFKLKFIVVFMVGNVWGSFMRISDFLGSIIHIKARGAVISMDKF